MQEIPKAISVRYKASYTLTHRFDEVKEAGLTVTHHCVIPPHEVATAQGQSYAGYILLRLEDEIRGEFFSGLSASIFCPRSKLKIA